VVNTVKGKPQQAERVTVAVESGLELLILEHAEAAAERAEASWRQLAAGQGLLDDTGNELGRASRELRRNAERSVREWQADVLTMVRTQGQDKRTTARFLAFGVNGLSVALMIVVFSYSYGLTGAEVGIAGGSAVLGQKLLEAVFGDQAVRSLAERARKSLEVRVRTLFADEQVRYLDVLDNLRIDPEAAEKLRQARAVSTMPGTPPGSPGHRVAVMTSLLKSSKTSLVSSGADTSGIGERIDGLAAAVEAAGGRLSDELVGEARAVVERAQGRLKLSADHTVVGIAGATGSGKSSTFNALTGLELSAVGVRRPTTSWATACVWGTQGARELLEWLGIPDRHQTTRDSMLDTRREGHELDGVVLLDLPDHDSTEVAHHLEVDRLVVLVDMLVWVLDPQKYADAAIHDRYLEPLKTHDEVMVVVLNHIDTVPEERRESMVADVRRLLDLDGLQKVPVIPVSAKQGWGIQELKDEIAQRAAEKKATRGRL
jgi:GTP-binding protein EngB required for normal cell division